MGKRARSGSVGSASERNIVTGNTITNSEYRVAIAQIKDGSDTEDKWVEFNEAFTYFEGKVYDSSKKYKMAFKRNMSEEQIIENLINEFYVKECVDVRGQSLYTP